jgi:hypothetical protein
MSILYTKTHTQASNRLISKGHKATQLPDPKFEKVRSKTEFHPLRRSNSYWNLTEKTKSKSPEEHL